MNHSIIKFIVIISTSGLFAITFGVIAEQKTPPPQTKKLYKVVDKDGKIHYSDQPTPGSEVVDLPELPSISIKTPKIKIKTREEELEENRDRNGKYYPVLNFATLKNDGVIRNNGGTATFTAVLAPNLSKAHFLEFYLDGKLIKKRQKGLSITAENVEYGPHSVSFSVVNARGVVQKSDTVKFNLLHIVRRSSKATKNTNQNIIRNQALQVDAFKLKLPEHPKVPTYESMSKKSSDNSK